MTYYVKFFPSWILEVMVPHIKQTIITVPIQYLCLLFNVHQIFDFIKSSHCELRQDTRGPIILANIVRVKIILDRKKSANGGGQ